MTPTTPRFAPGTLVQYQRIVAGGTGRLLDFWFSGWHVVADPSPHAPDCVLIGLGDSRINAPRDRVRRDQNAAPFTACDPSPQRQRDTAALLYARVVANLALAFPTLTIDRFCSTDLHSACLAVAKRFAALGLDASHMTDAELLDAIGGLRPYITEA